MKIKFKLSIVMIAIVAVVVTGVAVILLQQASKTSMAKSKQNLMNLTTVRAEIWRGRLNNYLETVRSVANIMSRYEDMPAEERRGRYDDMLLDTLETQPDFVRIFSIWKPNALDGMDSQYIGRTGATAAGQYAMTFGRDTGQIIPTPNLNVAETMTYLTGPNARKDRVEAPTPFKVKGEDTYIIRMGAPVINPNTNEVVGIVTCLFNIGAIQPAVENALKTLKEAHVESVYFNNGFILASYRPERIGKMLAEADKLYGDFTEAANEAVHAGINFECSGYSSTIEKNVEIALVSFQIGNSDTTWSIMIGSSKEYILKDVDDMTIFTIILAAVAIVVSAVIVYFTLNATTKPIVKVADTLKEIAEGEGDLTRTISVNSKDEAGDLAMYFNKTLEKIKNLVKNVKKEAVILSEIGNDLASNMTETAAAANQITSNIQSLKGRVLNQSASVSQTHATMEQVVANIHSVTETLAKNSDNVRVLTEASEVGRTGLEEVAADIKEIARESEGLLKINSVMQNIASQTNLLSMNAAIEAAHAGEAGRGFAVVADEIRKLAESSSEQSKTISGVLVKIKESIDKITRETESVLTGFEAIDSSVKTVSQQEENILNAMEEQEEGSKQVLRSAGGLNVITQQVKTGSNEMLEGAKEVIAESDNLEKVTQEITGGMNEMASGADQINAAINNVNDISNKTRDGINTLMHEVSLFIVD